MNTLTPGQDAAFDAALALMARDDPAPDPAAIRRREERDELMRIACQSAIDRAKGVDPALLDQAYLAWARDFVATHPPLSRPLGPGNHDGT